MTEELVVTHPDGKVERFKVVDGVKVGLHCDDGPAIEFPNGEKWYLKDNQLHRKDGPAIVRLNGHVEYWEHGKQIKTEVVSLDVVEPVVESTPDVVVSEPAPQSKKKRR
jgi:hypothetical protein